MARSGDEGFEQRLDRWVSAGRQFVDGVSGARPGTRSGGRRSPARLNPAELGRWVENKLDWLLDEEPGDNWREPWQAPAAPQPQPSPPQTPRGKRRPLEAISRRPLAPAPRNPVPAAAAEPDGDWPADDLFTVPRWQRQQTSEAETEPASASPRSPQAQAQAGRPLPRSSRRR